MVFDFVGAYGNTPLPVPTDEKSKTLKRITHKTINKVTEDMSRFHFNTAISALMELVNTIYTYNAEGKRDADSVLKEAVETVVILLAPFAPHIADELWESLGNKGSLLNIKWPEYDPAAIVEDEIVIVVQVNGKLRGKVTVPADSTDDFVKAAALADEKVMEHTAGKEIKKVVVVPKKLVNVVVG